MLRKTEPPCTVVLKRTMDWTCQSISGVLVIIYSALFYRLLFGMFLIHIEVLNILFATLEKVGYADVNKISLRITFWQAEGDYI